MVLVVFVVWLGVMDLRFGDDLERPGGTRGLAGGNRLRFRGCPACKSYKPGGPGGADTEQAHHLAARQWSAVLVQCGHQFGVGALPVRRTVTWLVRLRCGGPGAHRCTGVGALRCTSCSAEQRGRCSALQCGPINEGEQRAGL